MMRIRLNINDRQIGDLGVWNTEEHRIREIDNGVVEEIRYQVHNLRGYDMHGGSITDWPHIADVWHHQDAGAASLTAAVMNKVSDEPLVEWRK